MGKILTSILKFLLGSNRKSPPRVLRLPESQVELNSVYGNHDRLNGRYYLYADIVVEPDIYLSHVYFDADTWIAINCRDSETGIQLSDLFGRKIIASLITFSTGDYPQTRATDEEQKQFAEQWANKDTPL